MSTVFPPLCHARRRPAFRRALLAWFRSAARDLPWRRTRDPYRIWLSEVLLQQTRVETAVPFYERFVATLPTVHALAAAPLERVLKLWEGLGYYTRARNLRLAAQTIVRQRGGAFPATAEQWRELPGIGRYTAAAIASITVGEPIAAVDGNVRRVLARVFRLTTHVDNPGAQAQCWALAEALLARSAPGDFNQAMMELGARLCRPRRPACPDCPVRPWCAARIGGVQEQLPRRRPKRPIPHVEEVAAVIRRRERYLLVRRPPTGLLGGLWEFPGGPVGAGESPATALAARIRESLGIEIAVGPALASLRHAFSHRTLRLHVHACEVIGKRLTPAHSRTAKWILRTQIDRYALTRLTQKVLTQL